MIIGVHHQGKHNSRIKHTLDFIQKHPLNPGLKFKYLENGDLNISYGEGHVLDAYDFYMPKSNLFFQKEKVDSYAFIANSYAHGNKVVYSVEQEKKSSVPLLVGKNFQFDIFETIFFLVSRYEEVFCDRSELNEWDTMVEKKQFLIRNALEKTPIIDHLLVSFFELISHLPIRKVNSFTISHDIDHIHKYGSSLSILKKIPGHLYRRKSTKNLNLLIKEYNDAVKDPNKDPYNNFEWLLTTKSGMDKEIYFLVGGNHEVDTPIPLDNNTFLNAVKLASNRKYRIGIHPSYESWHDKKMIIDQRARLESITKSKINISRQHYLHFDLSLTPKLLIESGLKEDSSIGYNRHIGFRAGTGFPFLLYNFEEERSFEVKEKPLAFMDSSCWHESGKDKEKFEKLFNDFFALNQFNTHICTNFHNSFFNEALFNGIDFKDMYLKLVDSI